MSGHPYSWVRVHQRMLSRYPARVEVDVRLFQAINHLPHTPETDRWLTDLSDLGKGAGWVGAGLALGVFGGRRGWRAALAASAALLASTTLTEGPLKTYFRMRRPFATQLAIEVGRRPVDSSFPSGHTAASFAAATALSSAYPGWRRPLFLAAGAVGVSRVYLGHHFPSDVAIGAGLGVGLGLVCVRLLGPR
ncbi:MAG TPA: phosphatase PAP2 family protein [Candidatus Acidoferrales bacterium]|nr:phosphatase PAP2 family protein [Candidatus Acidoferrales bacterium]